MENGTAKRVILVVGATGHGKSTACNVLTDLEKIKSVLYANLECSSDKSQSFQTEEFPTSSGASALTSKCSAPTLVVGFPDMRVIDTPGFAESKDADVLNTLNLLKLLEQGTVIGAVLFITKETRVEEAMRNLLTLVENIFTKEVLERNLVVLLTNQRQLPTGTGNPIKERSARQQQEKNINNAQAIGETIQKTLSLEFAPTVWHVDCSPALGEEEEWNILKERRAEVLEHILHRPASDIKSLKFHKPEWMIMRDREDAAKVHETMDGLIKDLKDVPPDQKPLIEKLSSINKNISMLNHKLSDVASDLKRLDTSELSVVAKTHVYKKVRKELVVEVRAPFGVPIEKVDYLKDDKDDEAVLNFVKGEGYASVTYTSGDLMFKKVVVGVFATVALGVIAGPVLAHYSGSNTGGTVTAWSSGKNINKVLILERRDEIVKLNDNLKAKAAERDALVNECDAITDAYTANINELSRQYEILMRLDVPLDEITPEFILAYIASLQKSKETTD